MEKTKVMMVSAQNFLYKSDSGGSQASRRNYELLMRIFNKENMLVLQMVDEICEDISGVHVKQILIKNTFIHKYLTMLFLRNRYSKRNERDIQKYINEEKPDIVFFDGTAFGYIAKMFSQATLKIAFYHNIEKHYAIQRKNPMRIIQFFSTWMNERYITKCADIRICLNQRDDRLLYKSYHVHSDYLLPITFDDIGEESINKEVNEKNILLFVGSYFTPNIRGIKWFCKYVMPRVNQQLLIVGKGMEHLKGKLEGPKVKVIGGVNSLQNYYNIASAVVMPIFIGDGMKVKTAEAFMYGKTVFATNEALEGYDVKGIEGIHICNTAEEFINSLNNEHRYGFRQEVRDAFLDRYCTKAWESVFSDYLAEKIESWEKKNENDREKKNQN